MSTPHHPPWSTNSVPCHPISRHTELSGREGGGEGSQCRLFCCTATGGGGWGVCGGGYNKTIVPTHPTLGPVNSHNTHMCRQNTVRYCSFHVTTNNVFSQQQLSPVFACARITYCLILSNNMLSLHKLNIKEVQEGLPQYLL